MKVWPALGHDIRNYGVAALDAGVGHGLVSFFDYQTSLSLSQALNMIESSHHDRLANSRTSRIGPHVGKPLSGGFD